MPTYDAPMLVWMDLEMTGLDPARNVIVEIATIVTDDDLEIVAEGPDLVDPPAGGGARRDGGRRAGDACKEWVDRGDPRIDDLARRLPARPRSTFIKEHVPEPRTVPLCGNSIGTDRRFLSAYLNDIEEYLHYRSVDVSTLKELAKRWNPAILADQPRKETGSPSARRHPGEHRGAALLPGAPVPADRAGVRSDRGRAADSRGVVKLVAARDRSHTLTPMTATTRPPKQEQLPAVDGVVEVAPGVAAAAAADRDAGSRPRQLLHPRGRARLRSRRSWPSRTRCLERAAQAAGRRRRPAAGRPHGRGHPLPPRPLRRRPVPATRRPAPTC